MPVDGLSGSVFEQTAGDIGLRVLGAWTPRADRPDEQAGLCGAQPGSALVATARLPISTAVSPAPPSED